MTRIAASVRRILAKIPPQTSKIKSFIIIANQAINYCYKSLHLSFMVDFNIPNMEYSWLISFEKCISKLLKLENVSVVPGVHWKVTHT